MLLPDGHKTQHGAEDVQQLKPSVRYLIVCEDVVVDPDKPRHISLVGLISNIRSLEEPPFPLVHHEFCVFVQMTECRGHGEARIEIQHADSGTVTFRTRTRTIPPAVDPLEVVGLCFRIRYCPFPLSGLYWVQFWYNDEAIAQQPLLLEGPRT